MHRTADSIEASNSLKTAGAPKVRGKGNHPNSKANLKPFPKGVSGNPGGKPKRDIAKEIAQAIFENNVEGAYNSLGKALLKGNAYVFKELAERAYGKLKETHEVKHVHEDIPDTDLEERVSQLERECYPALYPSLTREAGEAARTPKPEGGTSKANGKAKDTPVLS